MPEYEYVCGRCRDSFKIRQTYEEFKALDECPACGGRIEQMFSPVGIIFRGPGFFTTDTRDDRVMSASGVLSHPVSKTDERNIIEKSPQRSTSKGKPLVTPTAPTRSGMAHRPN